MFYLLKALFILCLYLPVASLSAAAIPACYTQMQTSFFQQNLVAEALSSYRVNQALWHPIFNDLRKTSYQVPALIQARARASNPNPLTPVFIPEKAFQLLEDTLQEVYTTVLLSYSNLDYTINITSARGGFGYIWDKQYPRLKSCVNNLR